MIRRTRLLALLTLTGVAAIALVAVFFFLSPAAAAPEGSAAPISATAPGTIQAPMLGMEVLATGLSSPRDLIFDKDGNLFIAEAGAGGPDTNPCKMGPEADVCLGDTGAVTRLTFDSAGNVISQMQVITGLASVAVPGAGPMDNADAVGPHDIAFDAAGNMYLSMGLGGSASDRFTDTLGMTLGHLGVITGSGTFTTLVDISAYEDTNNPDGSFVDSNPFYMTMDGDSFILADAGANALYEIMTPTMSISTVAVFPTRTVELPFPPFTPTPMEAVPTGVEIGPDGAYYVGQLTGFPFPVDGARVYRVEPGMAPEIYADGFTNIVDIEFGSDGSLYVLEMSQDSLLQGVNGAVTRVAPNGSRSVLASGLIAPLGMTVGPDDALYITNIAISNVAGQVVRVQTPVSEADQFISFLSGEKHDPPIDTEMTGIGHFTLVNSTTLQYEVAVSNSMSITLAHIHEGGPDEDGPPIFTLYDGTGDFDDENPISGTVMLTPTQLATLLAGDYYVNVHTTDNPGGEVRGQILKLHEAWLPLIYVAEE